MRYVEGCLGLELRQHSYRVYVTDMLYAQGHNQTLTAKWSDLIKRNTGPEKSAEEIVQETIMKAGLTLKE